MNKTVLIVDDDDVLRRALAHGLQNNDFNVITADSAEMAGDVLGRITVDAIVLDRMMTGTDGLTFLKTLRDSGDATPVIMLTAMTGAENAIDGLDAGADDYLAKPFQLRELVLRLNNMMRSRTGATDTTMPDGLVFTDDEFFVSDPDGKRSILGLSGEEKKLLTHLTRPMGNIAPASPMVAKRLRIKLNSVLSNVDIITIRGRGYKLIYTPTANNNGEKQ